MEFTKNMCIKGVIYGMLLRASVLAYPIPQQGHPQSIPVPQAITAAGQQAPSLNALDGSIPSIGAGGGQGDQLGQLPPAGLPPIPSSQILPLPSVQPSDNPGILSNGQAQANLNAIQAAASSASQDLQASQTIIPSPSFSVTPLDTSPNVNSVPAESIPQPFSYAPLSQSTIQPTQSPGLGSAFSVAPPIQTVVPPGFALESIVQMAMSSQATANPNAPIPQIVQPIVIIVAPQSGQSNGVSPSSQQSFPSSAQSSVAPVQQSNRLPGPSSTTGTNRATPVLDTAANNVTKTNITGSPFKLSLMRTTLIDNIFFRGTHINEVQPGTGRTRAAVLIKEVGDRFLPLRDHNLWKGKAFAKSLGEGLKAFFQSIPALFELGIRQGR